jgi:hypothetical protein
MFISSYLYLKQYESDRTNNSNVYNEDILIQKIWTICDAKTHSRRKTYQVRYAPQNVHTESCMGSSGTALVQQF